ncbi:Acetylornithine aminotransferase [Poriferisphaera corsica]|uniref:Acetylornithine aminotransferase n=1 Tax=Poriferisphaera corsica TaxID=2528020 RepID=A0A517YZ34_9BACT|nr:aminotransferase class III-fold pyridoxal phosphate-dependent enzyme [Poriferisphaera corsica]QDU35449.1 Acetylornithine aminotransferase [Poriferisphaera corsica]
MTNTANKPATAANKLMLDPRVTQAKALLHEALADHAAPLNNVRPPVEELKIPYEQALEHTAALRGGGLFFPYLGSGLGNGPFVELGDGSVKLDFITGIGVHFYGHNHPDLVDTSVDAALQDTIMQGNLQQNLDTRTLLDLLMQLAKLNPESNLQHCFMTSSGSMANDNAFKLALQKNHPASRILAFEHNFCGRTIAMSSVTDKAAYRVGLPTTLNVDYVPYFDETDPEGSTALAVKTLKRHLKRYPDRYALMKFEIIQGEGGYNLASRDFHVQLMEICKENNIAVFADEIQTFGRTTKPFAFQHYNLDKYIDIVNIGKLSQVCATFFTEQYKPKPGLLSQTFTSSGAQIRAGIRIADEFLNGDLFGDSGKIMTLSNLMRDKLQALADKHPGKIAGPFGLGAMIAFTPYDGSLDKAKQLMMNLYNDGLLCFLAGGNPTWRLRMLPPIPAIDESHINLAIDLLDNALSKMD